jgi:hypothetical protein
LKIVAIIILVYFMMGFCSGLFIIEHQKPQQPAAWYKPESPPYELPLEILLLGIFLALPVAGVIRAKKQGTFLHLPQKFWLWGPGILFIVGLSLAFPAWRYLK